MRVVLLNARPAERDAMVRALPQESYRVEAVGDEAAALAAIAREAPQVVVFSVPAKGGQDLAHKLRGAENAGEAYLLAIVEATPVNEEISQLICVRGRLVWAGSNAHEPSRVGTDSEPKTSAIGVL